MKAQRIILFLFFLVPISASLTLAETVVLKSGLKVEGKIVEQTKDKLKLDLDGAQVTYYSDELATVDGQPFELLNHSGSQVTPAVPDDQNMPAGSEGISYKVNRISSPPGPATGEGIVKAELAFSGRLVSKSMDLTIEVTRAFDDTGRNLRSEAGVPNREQLKRRTPDASGQVTVEAELKAPAREATTIQELAGEAILYLPDQDPAAIFRVNGIMQHLGQPVEVPGQKTVIFVNNKAPQNPMPSSPSVGSAFGGTSSGSVLTVDLTDPDAKVVALGFFSSAGKKLKPGRWSGTSHQQVFSFKSPLPTDTSMAVYLMTDGALKRVPFVLTDVRLPRS